MDECLEIMRRECAHLEEIGSEEAEDHIKSNQKRGDGACEDAERQIEGTTGEVNASGAGGFTSLRSHGGNRVVGDAPERRPVHKHRTHTDELEPLFENNLLIRILNQRDGSEWLEEHLGIPKSTAAYWKRKITMDIETVDPAQKGAEPEVHKGGLRHDQGSSVPGAAGEERRGDQGGCPVRNAGVVGSETSGSAISRREFGDGAPDADSLGMVVAEIAQEEKANSRSGPGESIREAHSGASAGSGTRRHDQLRRDGIPVVRRRRVHMGSPGRGWNPNSCGGKREAIPHRYESGDDGWTETAIVRDREGKDDAIRDGFGSGEG
jgi:hypothetical protein